MIDNNKNLCHGKSHNKHDYLVYSNSCHHRLGYLCVDSLVGPVHKLKLSALDLTMCYGSYGGLNNNSPVQSTKCAITS